jgi:hypothetical protein
VNLERLQRMVGKVDYWLATSNTVILVEAKCSVRIALYEKQQQLLRYMVGTNDRIGPKKLWGVLTDGTEWQFYTKTTPTPNSTELIFMFKKISSNDLKLIINVFMYLLK